MEFTTTPSSLNSRKDLADYIGLPLGELNNILYAGNRSRFYKVKMIPKASGGERKLHAISGELKSLQRMALDKLQTDYPPSPRAHGFVPERSIITNARHHTNKKLVIKLDLLDFFPTIHYGRVVGMFQKHPFSFGYEVAKTLAQISCLSQEEAGILPQGGAMSPYIANVICRRMDKRLASVARNHRCNFTRYADDLTFSTNDVRRLEIPQLITEVSGIVESEGFKVNSEKTRVLRPSDRQIVTGIVVNDGLNVPRKYINSLRAILHNMEKEGIEQQLVKGKLFGANNPKISRLEFELVGEGYRLGSRAYSKDEAVDLFLRHLLGRFAFVGQVVNANGQQERQIKFKRVILYKRLLKRFHNCVIDPRNNGLGNGPKKCARAIVRMMKKYTSFDQESEWNRRIKEVRKSKLESWQQSGDGRRVCKTLDRINNLSDLKVFLENESKRDIRYWWVCGRDFETDKEQALKYASYPPVDYKLTRQILCGIKNTQGQNLGVLTHYGDDGHANTPAKLLEVLAENYEPYYYWLPIRLRAIIDPVSYALRDIVLQDGENVSLDIFGDIRLEPVIKTLKLETRLSNSDRAADGTYIYQLLKDAHEAGQRQANRKEIKSLSLVMHQKMPGKQYTVVPSLRAALIDIFHSMYANSESDGISVDTRITQRRCFQIRVTGPLHHPLLFRPSRNFAHGKLSRAARELFGIAGYWICSTFEDGREYRIDMLTGKAALISNEHKLSFSHIIVFPNDNDEIDESIHGVEVIDSVPENAPQRKIRVLLIDNNDQRRDENVKRWRTLKNVDIKAVARIDRASYEKLDLDLVLIHESNPEVETNELVFDDQTRIIVFSGGNKTEDCVTHEGLFFVSSIFLQKNLAKLIEKIVVEGQKDCVDLS